MEWYGRALRTFRPSNARSPLPAALVCLEDIGAAFVVMESAGQDDVFKTCEANHALAPSWRPRPEKDAYAALPHRVGDPLRLGRPGCAVARWSLARDLPFALIPRTALSMSAHGRTHREAAKGGTFEDGVLEHPARQPLHGQACASAGPGRGPNRDSGVSGDGAARPELMPRWPRSVC